MTIVEYADPLDARASAPVTDPPSCSLWINGARFADGQPDESELDPVALTDLRVVWGRANALDQPTPSTATFSVRDLAGGQTFLNLLHVGARVDIRTDAVIYPDPTIPMLPDPGFNAGVGSRYATAGLGLSVASGSLVVTPAPGVRYGTVYFPPAPLSGDPSAWNGVGRSLPGQTWTAGATVTTQSDLGTIVQTAALRAVYYRNPNGTDATLSDRIDIVTAATPGANVIGPDEWIPLDDYWIGLALEINPTGPAWQQLDGRSWDSLGAAPAWADLSIVRVDDLVLLAPAEGQNRSGLVFSGLITDLDASYSLDLGGTLVKVIAQDWTADLANRYVGDIPWNKEALASRFATIIGAAGQHTTYVVDPAPGALQVTYRDVDSSSSLSLLQELGRTAGGVLWSATNLVTGPFLWLEDVDDRLPLLVLEEDPDDVIRIHTADLDTLGAITLSACSVALTPVHWLQTSDDDGTRVVVSWLEQTVDDKGQQKPTTREESVIDAGLEASTGVRRVALSTQLTSSADAHNLGVRLLARLKTPGWRVTGLELQLNQYERLDAEGLTKILTLLDGTTRIGCPILLTDLPEWSPIAPGGSSLPLYLEGGRLSNLNGYWTLELVTSDGGNTGSSVHWDELPADWLWNEFDPAISWLGLTGVGV
jgi:hypothetical protein